MKTKPGVFAFISLLKKSAVLLLTFSFLFQPVLVTYADDIPVGDTVIDSGNTTDTTDTTVIDTGSTDTTADTTTVEQTNTQVPPPSNVTAEADTTDAADQATTASLLTSVDTGNGGAVNNGLIQGGQKQVVPQPDLSTGALTYNYPIVVPPGRNGLTPDVSLSYNNQNKIDNSIVGYGWSINIPYIQRLNKTGTNNLYTDNYFTSSIDGELALVSGTTYAPKVENGSFNSYTYDGTTWTVTDKNGTTYKFGSTVGARQDDQNDSTKVYKWMLEEVRDTNSNYISYSYFKDQGQIYPDTIAYTGNGTTAGIFKVVFGREAYSVSSVLFYPAFGVTTAYRINSITASVNNQWVHKYDLAYTTGDAGYRMLLSSVTESGQDTDTSTVTTLPAATFSYRTHSILGYDQTTNGDWQLPEYLYSSNTNDSNFLNIIDINGDSYPDVLRKNDDISQGTYLNNTQTGWGSNVGGWVLPMKFKDITTTFKDNGVRMFDVNGDFLNDFTRSYSSTFGTGTPTNESVYLNSGNGTTGWVQNTSIHVPIGYVFGSGLEADNGVRVVDVNGDGIQDILYSYLDDDGAGLLQQTYLGTGSGWVAAPSGTWQIPFAFIDENPDGKEAYTYMHLADINGDGLVDMYWSYQNWYHWWMTYNISTAWINTGKGWAERTFGTSWVPPTSMMLTEESSGIHEDGGYRVSDLNGDNIPDAIQAYQTGSSSVTNYLGLGSHNEFGSFVSTTYSGGGDFFTYNGGTTNNNVAFQDVNGDGIDDMLHAESNASGLDMRTYLAKTNNFTDILTSVTLPQGGGYTFGYKLSNQYRNADNSLMNPNLPIVVDTVNTITTTDPVNSVSGTTTYTYANGSYYYTSPTDRKFAGFGTVTQTDATGNVTKTYYHQGNTTNTTQGEYNDTSAKIGKAYRTELYDNASNLYQLTVNKWDSYNLGTGRDFVKLIRSTSLAYDGNSGHKDTSTEYAYDNTNGNLTTKTEWGEVTGATDGSFTDTGTDKGTTTYTYATNGSGRYALSQETLNNQSGGKVTDTKNFYDSLAFGSMSTGNLTKERHWETGSTWADTLRSYNSYGLVATKTDPRGKLYQYSYDTYNLYPATVTDPLTHTKQYLYDYSIGKPKQTTEENSFVYKTIYDGLDRVIEEDIPDFTSPYTPVTKSTYTYTDTSGAVSVKQSDYLDTATQVDTYQYFDGLHRMIQERKEAEATNTFNTKDTAYNNLGLILKESLPYASTGTARTTATSTSSLYTNYTYDPLKRPLTIANNVGTTSYAYNDWKTTITDANSKQKILTRDAYNNLAKVDEKNSGSTYTTNYKWNLINKLTKITDANSNIRNFDYNGLGLRISAEDLHASADTSFGAWSYTYDDNGNLTQTLDPKSQTINYTYDDVNRIATEDYTGATGTEITYGYDSCTKGIGKLCSVTMTSGANTTYTYDADGNEASEGKTISGTTYTTSFIYDRQANPLVITYPDNSSVKYVYTAHGLVNKIRQKESGGSYADVISNVDYSPTDKPSVIAYANGLTTNITYDSTKLYRPTSVVTGTIQNEALTYDALGNVLTKNETGSAINSGSFTYGYDDLSRLTSISATGLGSGSNFSHTYGYDAIGNISSKSDVGTYLYQGNSGTNYANPHAATSVNGTTVTYDNNGNLLTDGTATNTWNYKNQLTQTVVGSNTVTYSYDDQGNRLKYVIGSNTTVFPNKYYDAKGTTLTRHLYLADQPIATLENNNGTFNAYGLLPDYLGSTSLTTNSSGSVVETLDYYPFGDIRLNNKTGSFEEKRKFTKHLIDADTNFTYLNARYYEGSRGQFISQDPTFWTPESLLQDPQQLNSYSYARNNPITYVDPDGRSVKTFVQGAATSFAVGLLIAGAIASAPITIPAAALTAVGIAGTAAVGYGTYSNYQAYQNGNITKDQFDYNAGSLLGGLIIPGMAGKGASQAGEAESAISARFTQTGVSPEFNPKGSFAGKSLDEVISSLKAGSMSPSDLPINYIEGNGGRLVDNNRSAYVLQQAGIPESKWNWQTNNVNNPEVISRIEQKLFKNGLTNAGTDSVRVTSGKK